MAKAQRNPQLPGGNGDGGDDYFDTGVFDQLLEIKIRYGGAIDAIFIKYTFDGITLTRVFGGRGGEKEATITFQEGEFLTKITGYFSPGNTSGVVRSLTFWKNDAIKYGPYGPEEGTVFSVPAVKGKIVGFFGYAGTFLDAIGVHVQKLL